MHPQIVFSFFSQDATPIIYVVMMVPRKDKVTIKYRICNILFKHSGTSFIYAFVQKYSITMKYAEEKDTWPAVFLTLWKAELTNGFPLPPLFILNGLSKLFWELSLGFIYLLEETIIIMRNMEEFYLKLTKEINSSNKTHFWNNFLCSLYFSCYELQNTVWQDRLAMWKLWAH